MNILFIHSGSDLYGASRSLLRLATRLVRDGHGVSIVLPSEGPLVAELQSAGADTEVMPGLPLLTRSLGRHPIRAIRTLADISPTAARLADKARASRADIVHTNTATVLLASAFAARRAHVPHVWHVREFFHEFGVLWQMYRAAMLRNSQRVVCVSRSVAEQFGTPIPERVAVIHNGFPAAEFEGESPGDARAFRDRFHLGESALVGLPGRIKLGRKGQEVFIRAARLLRDRYPDARFLLIGSPFPGNESHLAEATNLIKDLGLQDRVVYTGDVADIKNALRALDVAVLASATPEPFGGVVVEAMACGKPVVGTRLGGTTEQIVDGVTGILVEPNDAAQMAEAIDRLLADAALRRKMGDAGRQRFLEHFEFEAFYVKMLAVYRELAQ